MSSIRKVRRNSSPMNKKAEFIQVSYFNFSTGTHVAWRRKKYQETSPKQKNLNEKRSKRYFEALVEANFKGYRDYVVHLTFSKENYPESEADAQKQVKNWIARLNYKRKKKGLANCHYIIIFEVSKTGRYHFHILMDGALHRDIVEAEWKLGFCNVDRLQPDPKDGLQALIKYLSKDSKGSKRWIPSKGLVKPWVSPIKSTKISNKRFEMMRGLPEDSELMVQTIEKDNKGYKLLSIEKEFREETGQWFYFCRMRLKEPKRSDEY